MRPQSPHLTGRAKISTEIVWDNQRLDWKESKYLDLGEDDQEDDYEYDNDNLSDSEDDEDYEDEYYTEPYWYLIIIINTAK